MRRKHPKPMMLFGLRDGIPFAVAPYRPIVVRYVVEEPDGVDIFTIEAMAERLRCKPESLQRIWLRQFTGVVENAEAIAAGKVVAR